MPVAFTRSLHFRRTSLPHLFLPIAILLFVELECVKPCLSRIDFRSNRPPRHKRFTVRIYRFSTAHFQSLTRSFRQRPYIGAISNPKGATHGTDQLASFARTRPLGAFWRVRHVCVAGRVLAQLARQAARAAHDEAGCVDNHLARDSDMKHKPGFRLLAVAAECAELFAGSRGQGRKISCRILINNCNDLA